MKKALLLLTAVVFVVTFSIPAFAADPVRQIAYTKTTTLADGTYTIRFSLWNVSAGGDPAVNKVWEEEKSINVASGSFKTNLGSVVVLDPGEFWDQLWVQLEKNNGDGTYTQIGTNRERLPMVAYAMWSLQAETGGSVTSVTAGSGLSGTGTTGDITLSIPNGGVTTSMLAGSSITAAKIAAGAVTDAKITGLIGTDKLIVGTGSGTVAAGDHNHDAAYVNENQSLSISSAMLKGGSVTTAKIAAGAVTDAKDNGANLRNQDKLHRPQCGDGWWSSCQ